MWIEGEMMNMFKRKLTWLCMASVVLFGTAIVRAQAPPAATKPAATKPKPAFPPHSQVMSGYEKVVSTADGSRSLYTLWVKKKEGLASFLEEPLDRLDFFLE